MPVEPTAIGPLLSFNRVTVHHGRDPAILNISFTVEAGEIVTVVGPNGAGKSTLIRTALGILRPESGSVNVASQTALSYVPQSVALDRSLPMDVGRFLSLSGIRDKGRQQHTLGRVGAPDLGRRSIHDLSGGEMRRVLLARALLRTPNLLILDEPTAGVDVSGQASLYQLIQEIRDEYRCGVLLVSHDVHIVMAATDRVLCLNRHLCCQGKPEQVKAHPEYLAMFGAHESEAIGVYRHQHDHQHGLDGAVCHHD